MIEFNDDIEDITFILEKHLSKETIKKIVEIIGPGFYTLGAKFEFGYYTLKKVFLNQNDDIQFNVINQYIELEDMIQTFFDSDIVWMCDFVSITIKGEYEKEAALIKLLLL